MVMLKAIKSSHHSINIKTVSKGNLKSVFTPSQKMGKLRTNCSSEGSAFCNVSLPVKQASVVVGVFKRA